MAFLPVRDMRLRYEVRGDGPPLVLLNGALDTIESDWERHLAAFAAHYRVFAYDHRGHGQSDNPARNFTGYEMLVDDLVAFLDALGIGQALFCGFSDGAITLKYFALRYPERARSLVLAGGQYTIDDQVRAMNDRMAPDQIVERQPAWAAQLAALHDTHHSPGYWQTLLNQMRPMWYRQPDLSLDQLGRIAPPTLLIAGERDRFGHLDQQVAMRRAIPGSQLCIAPAAGHFVMNDQPELFRLVTLDFLQRNGGAV